MHPNNNHVYDKLFTFKLPCVNSSADDIAVLQYEQFFKYISFYVLKTCSLNGVFLCLPVFVYSSTGLVCLSGSGMKAHLAQARSGSWQRHSEWKHFFCLSSPLLSSLFLSPSFSVSCFSTAAVVGHILTKCLSLSTTGKLAQVCPQH